jgi:hypothetical protein
VTELVGWEHSMKNELIVATRNSGGQSHAAAAASKSSQRLQEVLGQLGLSDMRPRFFTPLVAQALQK